MDKKTLQFIIVTLLFITAYQFFALKQAPSPLTTDNKALIQTEKTKTGQKPQLFSPVEGILPGKPEKISRAEFKYIYVTYSTRGGYIVNVQDKKYGEPYLFHNFGYISEFGNLDFSVERRASELIFFNKEKGLKKSFTFSKDTIKITIA